MKEIDSFLEKLQVKNHEKGKILIKEGETIDKIFFLVKGSVRQYLKSKTGSEISIHVYKPGSFFPFAIYLSKAPNRFYFETLTKVKVKIAKPEKVKDFLKKEPKVLLNLTKRLSMGLNGMVLRLEKTLEGDVRARLLSLLKYFAENFGRKGKRDYTIQISLTHKDLANWLGVSRETVSRQMKVFEKEKIIVYKKRKILVNAASIK